MGWSIADNSEYRNANSDGSFTTDPVPSAFWIHVTGTLGGFVNSSDATLSALALADASDDSAITISPEFASGTTSYTASVDNDVDEITIEPTVNESNATFKYLDSSDTEITDADSGKTGQQVSLTEGANTIKVKVTADDATTTSTYTVVVTRALAGQVFVDNTGQATFANNIQTHNLGSCPVIHDRRRTPGGYTLTSIECGSLRRLPLAVLPFSLEVKLFSGYRKRNAPVAHRASMIGSGQCWDPARREYYHVHRPVFNTSLLRMVTPPTPLFWDRSVQPPGISGPPYPMPTTSGTSGWSIGDSYHFTTGGPWSLSTIGRSAKIAIRGTIVGGVTNNAPTAADKTVTTDQDTAYTFTATDFGFADTDTGDTLVSVRIESLPALGALALNGTTVSLNDVIPSADIGGLIFTPAAGESGDDYASFMFKVNDGTDFSADPNTITFNVRDLSCAAPDFSVDNRRQLWTGMVTVEDINSAAYGFHSDESLGGLNDATFAIGRNSYAVDLAFVQSTTSSAGRLSFGLAGGVNNNLTAGEVAALRLHVCDTVYDFSDATLSSNTYAWAGSLDWSPPVATRTLYLSLPANHDAIGAPTITGTAQTEQELTADVTGITDADGLTGDLSTLTDDGNLGGVEYSYQWLRVDSDGTSNETEITGEIASTYTLAAADVGKKVKVKVGFTDDLNGVEERTSEAYPASATVTAATVPDEPTGLTATAAGAFRIDLAWTAPDDTGGSAITGYRIEVSSDGASWSDLVANTASTATTYAHTGLDGVTTRHYRVSAINAVGTSVPSDSDEATTGASTITAQGDVWSGTVTVSKIDDYGYLAAAHPLTAMGGTLSDDDFVIGGTTYTVWRITVDTDSKRPHFTVATGTPPAVTKLPGEDELILRLTYGGETGDFALSDTLYLGSGNIPSQGHHWSTGEHPSGTYPSSGETMTVTLLVNAAPTADNNTVLTPRDTAYTFTASEFGFADANAGDTLASVRIVSLPAAGTLALAGAAVTTNQVVTKAQIDGNNLTFTPVAGASGDDYATFTFKVNDGIVDSDDAYTMTIDVTVTLFAPGPPTGLAATARGQSIDLAWTAPANTGGSPITGYRIEVSPDGTSSSWTDLVADTAEHRHHLLPHGARRRHHPPLPRLRHQRRGHVGRLRQRRCHHRGRDPGGGDPGAARFGAEDAGRTSAPGSDSG